MALRESWDGVEAPWPERVAAGYAPDREDASTPGTMSFKRLNRIRGARWKVPARRWEEGTNRYLISPYEQDEEMLHPDFD